VCKRHGVTGSSYQGFGYKRECHQDGRNPDRAERAAQGEHLTLLVITSDLWDLSLLVLLALDTIDPIYTQIAQSSTGKEETGGLYYVNK